MKRSCTRHGCRRVGLAAVLLLAGGSAAQPQGLPAAVGPAVQLGDLRQAFQRAFDGAPAPAAAGGQTWTITPSIDVEATATDNARGLGTFTRRRGSEFFTTITPGIVIQGETARLRGTFAYSPRLRMYANEARQNGISHNLTAGGRATIFENLLFLNANAYMADTSRAGGIVPTAGGFIQRNDRVQTSSFSIGPQLQHRFGDYMFADAAYQYSQTSQTGRGTTINTPFAPALSNLPTSTHNSQVSLRSGPVLGRTSLGFTARHVLSEGGGVLRGARRHSEVVQAGYAVTRLVTMLGEIGYEDIRYGGIRPLRISGIVWSVGVRWNPDPDTTMTLSYGHRDGGDSFSFNGVFAPTARIRVSARYSEGVSTGAEDLQNALAGADFDPFGAPIDRASGIPLTLADNFGGQQGGVSRVRRISATSALLRDADTFSLTVLREERRLLSANVPGAASSIESLNASLAWQRELRPGLRGNAAVSYGNREASGAFRITQETVSFSAGVTYAFSDTLSARGSYTLAKSSSNLPGFGYTMNLVTVGMRKTF